jgi:hypothetical protein
MLVVDRNVEPQSVMQTSLLRSLSAGELEGGVRMGLRRLLYVCILPHDAIIYSSDVVQEEYQDDSIPEPRNSTPGPPRLRINADLPAPPPPQPLTDECTTPEPTLEPSLEPSLHIPEEHLFPTHLSIYHFGSRFLPHSTAPIRCILPLQHDRLLLVGTDVGLSVLNMFPTKWADETSPDGVTGLIQQGPADAQARVMWTGEA